MDFACSPFFKTTEKTSQKFLLIDLTFFGISNGTPLSEIMRALLCPLRMGPRFFFDIAFPEIIILYFKFFFPAKISLAIVFNKFDYFICNFGAAFIFCINNMICNFFILCLPIFLKLFKNFFWVLIF